MITDMTRHRVHSETAWPCQYENPQNKNAQGRGGGTEEGELSLQVCLTYRSFFFIVSPFPQLLLHFPSFNPAL